MNEENNNIEDKMNSSEPEVVKFEGKPTMTWEEAVAALQK